MEDIGMNPEFRARGPGFEESFEECYYCGRPCEDHCWHCEKPVCVYHSTFRKTAFALALYCDRCYGALEKFDRMTDPGLPYHPTKLYIEGYLPVPPYDKAREMNSKSIHDATCAECHHGGLVYEPWSKPGSYMAIAMCPNCGHREEY
jgi:hypothetical protein